MKSEFAKCYYLIMYLPVILIIIYTVFLSGCSKKQVSDNIPHETEMIIIPKGDFMMGDNSKYSLINQKPIHKVNLREYYIDKTEVTVAQFEEFIQDNGYKTKKFWTKNGWEFIQMTKDWEKMPLSINRSGFDNPNQPVSGITWYEADAYARWCNKRLLTEAEWERAARGTDGRVYPWGNEMDYTKLYYILSGTSRLKNVGSYSAGASPDGILDMSGSLWEWTSDWYEENYYSITPIENPTGPNEGNEKILRGGAWNSDRLQWKSTYRNHERPGIRRFDIGFRCARSF